LKQAQEGQHEETDEKRSQDSERGVSKPVSPEKHESVMLDHLRLAHSF
jgi:hypothetical protein